jgi:hypothetical protein
VRFACIVLLACLASPASAAVTARLSADFIDELESVRLVIRATGTRQTETLDLTALEHDFHVMGTNSSSQYQYINGREQSWVDYQITLQPKRTGTLAIPRIEVGGESTNPLQLMVQPIAKELREKINELVFFENELSTDQSYVQAQVIVTRRLLYSTGVQLYSEIPGPPQIPDAVVLVLGETKSTQTMRNGKRYGMVEQRYAIFPETSGELMIPGVSITASVRIIDEGRVTRKGVRVGTKDLVAKILSVPESYPREKPWVPAEAITIVQTWTPQVTNTIDVGDTLERRIDIRIHGNTGSIAPPLQRQLDSAQFRQYPQSPSIDDDTRGESVVGIRTETISVVPQVPGSLTVPGETITWWDTISNELRITQLPDIALNVLGTAIQPATDPTAAASAPILEFVDELADDLSNDDVQDEAQVPLELDWQWILIAVLAVAAIFGLVRLRPYLRLPQPIVNRFANASQGRTMLRAVRSKEVSQVKDAVVRYLRWHPQLHQSQDARALLNTLNHYLYRDDKGVTSDRQSISDDDRDQLIRAAARLVQSTKQPRISTDLPNLYAR